MPVKMSPGEAQAAFEAAALRGVRQATQALVADIKVSLSTGQPTRRVGGRMVGLRPSTPPDPPRTVTGRLRNSIASKISKPFEAPLGRSVKIIRGTVGTNVVYARRLELGVSGTDRAGRFVRQKPRPFLFKPLRENPEKYFRIVLRAARGV